LEKGGDRSGSDIRRDWCGKTGIYLLEILPNCGGKLEKVFHGGSITVEPGGVKYAFAERFQGESGKQLKFFSFRGGSDIL
jgi:hypothetical protein